FNAEDSVDKTAVRPGLRFGAEFGQQQRVAAALAAAKPEFPLRAGQIADIGGNRRFIPAGGIPTASAACCQVAPGANSTRSGRVSGNAVPSGRRTSAFQIS